MVVIHTIHGAPLVLGKEFAQLPAFSERQDGCTKDAKPDAFHSRKNVLSV
jgi:hypothetical protein